MISSDLEHKIKDSGRRFIPLISNAAKLRKRLPRQKFVSHKLMRSLRFLQVYRSSAALLTTWRDSTLVT
ncbi:MAG: hypothetical protein HC780_24245 [Leptolyngbyaceae cyanobacterium CSU_1_3]|nr:hypothetical protein [Leptolyngbyaceae cyanobacterium CSU_1_3]